MSNEFRPWAYLDDLPPPPVCLCDEHARILGEAKRNAAKVQAELKSAGISKAK